MQYQTAKEFCENHGYNHRKMRYVALEDYFGISGDTIRDIISFDRYLRDILNIDEVGEEKEKEWHKTENIHNYENSLFPLRKLI